MNTRYFKCEKGHILTFVLADKAYKKFVKLCNKLLRVCSQCKPENVRIAPTDENPVSEFNKKWGNSGVLTCKHGHVTKVSAFADGSLHFRWGDDDGQYKNFTDSNIDQLSNILNKKLFKCFHVLEKDGKYKLCSLKLKLVDGGPEIPVGLPGIKTRVRVGDIWDKAGVPEPRHSSYEIKKYKGMNVAEFKETEFDRRNKKRLERMRSGEIEIFDDTSKRQKTIRRNRVSKPAGEVIDRPTKRQSERISKKDALS